MVGIIIKQKFFESGPEPQEKTAAPAFDPQKERNEADQLYAQAMQLKAQARKKQAAEQDSSVEYKAAITKLKQVHTATHPAARPGGPQDKNHVHGSAGMTRVSPTGGNSNGS